MKEISSYSDLLFQDDSIWFSQKNETKIHYPEQGNSIFSQIEEKSFWYIHRNNVIVEIIKKHINPKSIFFEIGGGNGYVLSKIKDEGFDCVMLEPDLNGILIAQKRGINNLICSNFYDACFKNNTIPNIKMPVNDWRIKRKITSHKATINSIALIKRLLKYPFLKEKYPKVKIEKQTIKASRI